jgi:phosphatidate cytidylyltransferase
MVDDVNGISANSRILPRDFGPRVVSSLLLATVTVLVDYAGRGPFALLVLAVALLMCWEWGRVVRGEGLDATFSLHAVAVACAGVLAVLGLGALGVVVLVIGAILIAITRFGQHARLSALGVVYVGLPVVSLLWIRSDEPYGFAAILFILLCVWTTDTFAYIGGRLIGGARLWPRLSPNKTWAGLISGITASAVIGALFALFLTGASPAMLAASGLILGLVAQAGDLAESALKRGFGVKDTSSLIPGHGGFMDRLDGVVPVATAAALLALFANSQSPAQAVLFWS